MEIKLKVTLATENTPEDQLRTVPLELRHAVEEFLMNWSPVRVRVELEDK